MTVRREGAPAPGISRWAPLLGDLPADRYPTLAEGNTPLLPLPRLAKQLGLAELWGKLESVNPTGSYKDRAAALTIGLARAAGRRGWIATSSGNAGAALAAYGAHAGLPGLLFVVPTIPAEKLLPLLMLGVSTIKVEGVGDGGTPASERALFSQVRDAARRLDLQLGITAHAYNPHGMRGVDSLGLELAEQLPMAADVPIYTPCGGGGLGVAVDRGLRLGGRACPLVVVQPEGCAPVVRHLAGELAEPVVQEVHATISALQLPAPPDGAAVADAVRSSGGWGTAVPDAEILAAQQLLATVEGLFVEPASAAAVAGVRGDRRSGRLEPGASAVVVLTGHGLKNLAALKVPQPEPATITPDRIGQRVDRWLRSIE